MLRCGACLAALALAALVASPVFADETEDFMKKVDGLRYSPAEHGLKDFKVQVKNSMFAMNPAMAQMQVFVYWKAPDKSAAKIEGVEGAMAAQMAPMADSMKAMAKMIVPEPMSMMREKFDYTLTKEDGMVVLIGVPKPGTDEAGAITQTKTWFDDRGLPVRLLSEGKSASNMEMTYVEKEGKFLIETTKGEVETGQMGKQAMTMTFSYTQIEGMWFPEALTQEVMGMKIDMSFAGYEINKGLDDALFEETAPVGPDDDAK